MKGKIDILYTVLGILLLGLGCANEQNVAGGGTVVTNSYVTGQVISDNGTPAVGAEIKLVPHDHNPLDATQMSDILIAYTDMAGGYTFDEIDTGHYNIQALDPATGTQLLITEIRAVQETTQVEPDTLAAPGCY